MAKTTDWSQYYEYTRNLPPYSFLVEAQKYVKAKGRAIDIGGGALRDCVYLLKQGFEVTVIDNSPLLAQEATSLANNKLHPVIESFEDFQFPENEYDLASAMFSLNFCSPNNFDMVFEKIKNSLKKDGIFCCQLFGNRDKSAGNSGLDKTYPSREMVEKLLQDLEILDFVEKENDDKDADHEVRSGHVFQFVARK
jgi:SAM-dependent methyltransferase